jgi:DNA topoisomerase I
MTRLRRSRCSDAGIVRRRSGRGFRYQWSQDHRAVDAETAERIRHLAIPPAWEDVWICPWPNGHIQAQGTDAAGRRQYLYHEDWQAQRSQQKFDHVLEFAGKLPSLRRTVTRDIRRKDLGVDTILATAVRLLDIGCFRLGGETYAEEHETFGVATLRREHVHVKGETLTFDYPAKGSIRRVISVHDPDVHRVLARLVRRRSGGPELLTYKGVDGWTVIRSPQINDYIQSAIGEGYSAKDFRTWSGTLLAAALFAEAPMPTSRTARRRAEAAVIQTVADQLGNTPAVCRASYVDPRILDRFESGETIRGVRDFAIDTGGVARRRKVERQVIGLLDHRSGARST